MSLIGELQPEKFRPARMKVRPPMADQAQWQRLTQRDYLLYLLGAIQRAAFKNTRIDDARDILVKLNGMGGQW